ncbi:MAG: DUF4143 domain-containing protein, partial [Propionibacteriaceae bacterium]|nr:DUF4143 domain-containing protein [Propionibacteriaceae bacterium]
LAFPRSWGCVSAIVAYPAAVDGLIDRHALQLGQEMLLHGLTQGEKLGVTDDLIGQSAASLLPLTQSGIGALLEGFVVSELMAQLSWSQETYSMFHFRDRSGKEVDIVAELADGRVIALEVKASATYRTEHFTGLRYLRDQLGDRFIAGIVLGTSDQGYQFADRLWGLPTSSLWGNAGPAL